jgi:hypothetical protein
MALIDRTKEPEDLYRPHEYDLNAPVSKGKVFRYNKGYDPEVRRARYLRKKAEKENS